MTETEIRNLIFNLCNEAGKTFGIEFHWHRKLAVNESGWSIYLSPALEIIIRHWEPPEGRKRIRWRWQTPPLSEEEKDVFRRVVAEKIREIHGRVIDGHHVPSRTLTDSPNHRAAKEHVFPADEIGQQSAHGGRESGIKHGGLTLIRLEKIGDTLYVGRIEDDRLLEEAAFYLAVGGGLSEDRLIERVPRVIKIAWHEVICVVVGSALPGVQLRHASPPVSIAMRRGFQYFLLDTRGAYWDGIKRAKNIAVRVPDVIPDLRLKLYAVDCQLL